MKLYTSPLSGSARRVSVTVAHLGLGGAIEQELVDLSKAEARAALAAVNPNAKIPVLVDGDFVLWESHAIMQYLCDKTPGQTLWPSEPRARADVARWLFWVSSHFAPAIGPLNYERMWKKHVTGGPPDEAIVARYEGFFHQTAKVLDAHLAHLAHLAKSAKQGWVSGDAVTLADYAIAATLMYIEGSRLPIAAYPHVLAHVKRVRDLPAWQSTEPSRTT